jgi:DNA-binding MarR family transcriptional regulator
METSQPSPIQVIRSREELEHFQSPETSAQVFVIEESLGYLVNFLARLFSQIHAACLAPHGVYLGQWGVLMFLWAEDGLSQRQLSRQVAIDEAAMARAIDRLERAGLARRVRNEHDRRQINIFLTDKGHSLRDELVPCALASNAVAIQGFTEAEQHQMTALLRRMIAALEEAISPQPERT